MTSDVRLQLSEPLDDAGVPVVEMVAATRRAEARSVMATVAGLLDSGVPVRDIVVVARDLDGYEEPLYRAAGQYGIAPVFWTQLRVTRTTPFILIESVCAVLSSKDLDAATLCRPLEHRWSPPSASCDEWPLDPQTVQCVQRTLSERKQTLDEWRDEVRDNPDIDERLVTYIEWLTDCPAATPNAVGRVLGDVVDAYERLGLPLTMERDSPALVETERDARAVVRVKTLIRQLPHKYGDRLDEGALERSWNDVAELSRVIVTQRPGRREYSNARAVDVLEANDVWLLDVSYVISVGLIDGKWPDSTESPLPVELQEAILTGEETTERLAPRTAWTDGRDRDQFDDTVRAAGRGLILTRHAQTMDGEEQRPSHLLEYLDRDKIGDEELQALVGPDCVLPRAIRGMLPGDEGGGTDD